MAMPAQINPTFIWDWEAIESGKKAFDEKEFEKIPNFLIDKIKQSDEYKKFATVSAHSNDSEDSVQQNTVDAGPVSEDES